MARALTGVLCLTLSVVVHAAGERKNPTSKVFVSEIKGEAHIDNGEKIEPLSTKTAYSIEGSAIETKGDSSNTLVFSNGTAIVVGPNSRFEVKKFVQEPFAPNRNDLDVEPSISQTVVKLSRGSVGVCTSRLVAGSSMTYNTPHGTVNIRGHKVMLAVAENETVVTLIEGDVTVLGADGGNSQMLKPGQQAVLRRAGPDQPTVITVSTLSAEANSKTDDQVSAACIARRTVYFEAVEGAEIQPVQVQSANLPTQFTISRSRFDR
ncbi:MAG: FecR domain-containing protein [Nibricoccus sp.]